MSRLNFTLMGPTAIGKTDLACELTKELPLEIVNVDSSLMYRELNIGAAKPSHEILQQFPHHLVNCCDLSQVYSVAQFCEDVHRIQQEIHARGKIPLLVGGTMMYFQALQHGLAELPPTCPLTRERLLSLAQQYGWTHLYQQLQAKDPKSAQRIHPNDKQRILRGLEIFSLSGRPWSEFLEKSPTMSQELWCNIALIPEPRSWLHDRIAQRLDGMFEQGFLAEVENILSIPGLNMEHPALRSVGYRQAIDYLIQGRVDVNWQEKILFATRQLAKRQLTWLRSFSPKHEFFCPDMQIKTKIMALMKKLLDNNFNLN
jgi:tRNA dimethylallyltransferase